MAITTLDGVIAGLQPPTSVLKIGGTMEAIGVLHSLFYTAGIPGAAVAPSPGLAGAALTTYAGQIPWSNPVSGNAYLARMNSSGSLAGTISLYDRLWHNSGIVVTTTTAQTVNSVAWPARDRAGSTNGDGVLVGIEVSTATTNAAAITNTTMSYTNSAGTAGRTATIASYPATAVAGTFVPFSLQAGDVGVRSIQSITLGTSYVAGTIHLVAYRPIVSSGLPVPNVSTPLDPLTSGFPRLYSDSVPFIVWRPTATTAVTVATEILFAHG